MKKLGHCPADFCTCALHADILHIVVLPGILQVWPESIVVRQPAWPMGQQAAWMSWLTELHAGLCVAQVALKALAVRKKVCKYGSLASQLAQVVLSVARILLQAGEQDVYVTTGLSDEKELRQPFCSSALVPPEKLLNCAMEHVELQPSKPSE